MLKDYLALKPDQVAGPIVIAGLSIIAQFIGFSGLTFDRAAIQSGEYWRLISGHLVHTNDSHLAMSLAGVLVLWLLQGDDYNVRNYLTAAMTSAVGVSACLYYLNSGVNWYAGLSGLLHGLFAWGVTADLSARRHIGPILVVALLAKLLLEQTFGASPASDRLLGYPVVIDANLYGAAFGSLSGVIILYVRRATPLKKRNPTALCRKQKLKWYNPLQLGMTFDFDFNLTILESKIAIVAYLSLFKTVKLQLLHCPPLQIILRIIHIPS